ncbi:MAG: hypothetical protein D6736_11335 [Nitrospinota bacterium]|nr:MAG: hypothetical protein D6736_11335 [Nitrospinota bacterium]
MGRKGKRRQGQSSSSRSPAAKRGTVQQPQDKERRQMLFWSGAGALLALVGAGGYFFSSRWGKGGRVLSAATKGAPVDYASYQLRERGKLLPPSLFRGKVARAYQVAHEIPKVLDQLYCYCRCRENFGHKNLLSCYTNTHAST